MALTFEDKKAIVVQLNDVASKAVSAVAADYRGLTVAQMTDLRQKARQSGIYLKVVRNTLARRAVEDTDFVCMQDVFLGPTALFFAYDDPGSIARLVRDFAKENEALEVKALSISGQLLESSQLEVIAKLPSRDQALASLMSVMLAPVTKLTRTMSETYAQVVRVTAAVGEQKKTQE